MGQKQVVLRHRIIHFPTNSGVRERCEGMSGWTSEWPRAYVPILGRSKPLCIALIFVFIITSVVNLARVPDSQRPKLLHEPASEKMESAFFESKFFLMIFFKCCSMISWTSVISVPRSKIHSATKFAICEGFKKGGGETTLMGIAVIWRRSY